MNSPLAKACKAIESLRPFCKQGLGAIKGEDRRLISVPNNLRLCCTVNLDEAMKVLLPSENRWDYALEYDNYTFFIEVHPASTSEINCVIKKVTALKSWLKVNAPEVLNLPKKERGARMFYWVSSGRTDLRILPNSNYARKLALHHIHSVGREWNYAKLFK